MSSFAGRSSGSGTRCADLSECFNDTLYSTLLLPTQAFIYKRLEHKHKDDTSAEGGFASVIHRLGTNQAEDTYLWSDPANPQHSVLIPRVTDDGRHLLFDIFGSTDPVTRLLATEAPGLASRADPSFRDVNEDWDGSYYCATDLCCARCSVSHTSDT